MLLIRAVPESQKVFGHDWAPTRKTFCDFSRVLTLLGIDWTTWLGHLPSLLKLASSSSFGFQKCLRIQFIKSPHFPLQKCMPDVVFIEPTMNHRVSVHVSGVIWCELRGRTVAWTSSTRWKQKKSKQSNYLLNRKNGMQTVAMVMPKDLKKWSDGISVIPNTDLVSTLAIHSCVTTSDC